MELFFSPLACSMATRVALAEAGADVAFVEVDPITKRLLETGDDYRAINPLGYVPALRLDDGSVLTENCAVLHHVADLYPTPASPRPRPTALRARSSASGWPSFRANCTRGS